MRPLSSLENAETIADVAGPDLAALRAMPAAEVLALNGKIVPQVRRLTSPRALGPIRDGWVVPRTDTEAFASGQMQRFRSSLAATATRAASSSELADQHRRGGAELCGAEFRRVGGTMMSLYRLKRRGGQTGLSYAFGDTQFNYGVRGLARGMSAVQPKTWRYLFTRAPAGETTPPTHSEEIDYVFGNLDQPRFVPRGKMNAADRQLSDAMMEYWVHFAQTGDPNGGELPHWPAYDAATDPYLELGDAIIVRHNYRTPYLDFVHRFLAGQAAK